MQLIYVTVSFRGERTANITCVFKKGFFLNIFLAAARQQSPAQRYPLPKGNLRLL